MGERRAVAFDFERVTVLRAGRRVLDEVTAGIPAAGITVVSGPSGAGKTTLLRLCNRLAVPDAGRVRYRGQPLDELDPLVLRRRVGMVFQRPAPFPGSVADNLAVARPDVGAAELGTALKRVALDPGLLGQEARTLSGGDLVQDPAARPQHGHPLELERHRLPLTHRLLLRASRVARTHSEPPRRRARRIASQ